MKISKALTLTVLLIASTVAFAAPASAEVAPDLFTQLRLAFLAGLPHNPAKTALRIPQRHHKQPRSSMILPLHNRTQASA